jgi:hypothetical protein
MYPDSVRRVSPPKTTMPKTLAALPRSQYATTFDDVSGKDEFFFWLLFPVSSLSVLDCVESLAVCVAIVILDAEKVRARRFCAFVWIGDRQTNRGSCCRVDLVHLKRTSRVCIVQAVRALDFEARDCTRLSMVPLRRLLQSKSRFDRPGAASCRARAKPEVASILESEVCHRGLRKVEKFTSDHASKVHFTDRPIGAHTIVELQIRVRIITIRPLQPPYGTISEATQVEKLFTALYCGTLDTQVR